MGRKKMKRPPRPAGRPGEGVASDLAITGHASVCPTPVLPFWLPWVIVAATCAFVFWQLHPACCSPRRRRPVVTSEARCGVPTSSAISSAEPRRLVAGVVRRPARVRALYASAGPGRRRLQRRPALRSGAEARRGDRAMVFPVAAWALGRLSRLPEPIPACLAIAVIPFLFDDSYFQYGGNVLSSVAGEYGYGLGVPVALVALGVLDVALRTGRWRATAVVLAAIASLCHPVIGLMVVIGGAFLIGGHFLQVGGVAIRRAAPIVVLAPLIGAFWFLPFAWYRSELDPLNYSLGGGWATLFPLPVWAEILIVGLAAAGVVKAVRLRHPMTLMLVGTAVVCALAGARPSTGTHRGLGDPTEPGVDCRPHAALLVPDAGTPGGHRSGRPLPAGFRALGPGHDGRTAGRSARRRHGNRSHHRHAAPEQRSERLHPRRAGHPFEVAVPPRGRDESRPPVGDGRLRRLSPRARMAAISPAHGSDGETGKDRRMRSSMAENDPSGQYGSIFEFSLLPYWTKGCIDSMYGVPEDQSRNFTYVDLAQSMVSWYRSVTVQPGVSYQGLDLRQGVPLLRELGVRYYMAYTPMAKSEAASDPDLTHLASSGQWAIYEIRDVSLVQALTTQPVVVPAAAGDALRWLDDTTPWYLGATSGARPAAGGPSDWSRSPIRRSPLPAARCRRWP